uniref:glutathione transferase n=1 Tax=Timema monikensis TaxID=170555 RepID=A0A7R9EAK7_9NEOP|nr:unnamed protein product [Timema monikensis]
MAPTYKLTYFNVKGLGEAIRILLSYGQQEFEDNRIEFDEWQKIKPSKLFQNISLYLVSNEVRMATPFGKCPILEINGKPLHQSAAICRYLAKQFGLAGKDDWENLEIDMITDTITDFRIGGSLLTSSVLMRPLKQESKSYIYFSVILQLTWVDIYFVGIIDTLTAILKVDILEGYPHIKALKESVLNTPNIKAWVDKRPITQM